MSNLDLALIAILCGEVLGFLAFAKDKRRARAGLWRTPESTLLLFGLIGGLGAWMGQHILRHKTRKQPFSWRLHLIALAQALLIALGIGVALYRLRG